MNGKGERFCKMTPQQIESWIDKTTTAVGGAGGLSQESGREVARHALKSLFELTNKDQSASLQIVQQISDFAVRRRLLEVFRQSFVEVLPSFTSPIFFKAGDFADENYAYEFDRCLLILWQRAKGNKASFDKLIENYPNASRCRLSKRLESRDFLKKKRVRYVVQKNLLNNDDTSKLIINIFALLIFFILLLLIFKK